MAKPHLIFTLLAILGNPFTVQRATGSDIHNLFTDVILASDHRYRPLTNQNERMQVNISVRLVFLYDINELQQTFSACFRFQIVWTDELRQWTPEDYGGITNVLPDPLDIWRPRIFIGSSVGDWDFFKDNYAPMDLSSDGLTHWAPGGVIRYSCAMDLTYFPYDSQSCVLALVSGDLSNQVVFNVDDSAIHTDIVMSHGEWDVVESDSRVLLKGGIYQTVSFSMSLKRKPQFVVLNIIVPINLISSISVIIFLIPVESGERLSVSVTILLSLTVYLSEIYSELPKNSDNLPLLVIYLTALLVHGILVLITNMVVVIIYHGPYDNKEKFGNGSSQNEGDSGETVAQTIDDNRTDSTKFWIKQDGNLPPSYSEITRNAGVGSNSQTESSNWSFVNAAFAKVSCQFLDKTNLRETHVVKMFSFLCDFVGRSQLFLFALFTLLWIIIYATFSIAMSYAPG